MEEGNNNSRAESVATKNDAASRPPPTGNGEVGIAAPLPDESVAAAGQASPPTEALAANNINSHLHGTTTAAATVVEKDSDMPQQEQRPLKEEPRIGGGDGGVKDNATDMAAVPAVAGTTTTTTSTAMDTDNDDNHAASAQSSLLPPPTSAPATTTSTSTTISIPASDRQPELVREIHRNNGVDFALDAPRSIPKVSSKASKSSKAYAPPPPPQESLTDIYMGRSSNSTSTSNSNGGAICSSIATAAPVAFDWIPSTTLARCQAAAAQECERAALQLLVSNFWGQAVLEEAQAAWYRQEQQQQLLRQNNNDPSGRNGNTSKGSSHTNGSSSSSTVEFILPVVFTPSALLQRIKAGCALQHKDYVQQQQQHQSLLSPSRSARVSLRTQQQQQAGAIPLMSARQLWPAQFGGRVAESIRSLETDNDNDEDSYAIPTVENRYLRPTGEALRAWLGGRSSGSSSGPKQWTATEILDHVRTHDSNSNYNGTTTMELRASDLLRRSSHDVTVWSRLLQSTDSGRALSEAWQAAKDVHNDDDNNTSNTLKETLVSADTTVLLEPLHPDAVDVSDPTSLARSSYTIRIVNDDLTDRIEAYWYETAAATAAAQKAQDIWQAYRTKSRQMGYCRWPSWMDECRRDIVAKTTSTNTTPEDDHALAQRLHDEATAAAAASMTTTTLSGSRTTSRRKGAVFYGNQSNLSLKQLMEACLRLSSSIEEPKTVARLISHDDGSSDPMRRIRTALGRLVYKRNQLSVHRVTMATTPALLATLSSDDATTDEGYRKSLMATEEKLRRIVMHCLTDIPVALIATAADDRLTGIDNMDALDFDSVFDPTAENNSKGVEWQTTGHTLIGTRIFRPTTLDTSATHEATPCTWFRIQDYVPSVPLSNTMGIYNSDEIEVPSIGIARDCLAVERRARFRAVSESTEQPLGLVLTHAQVHAGLAAATQQGRSTPKRFEHPFTSGEISLCNSNSSSGEQMAGTVVGHDTIVVDNELRHKIYVLPKAGPSAATETAFWATLYSGKNSGALMCSVDGSAMMYEIQQFDYHKSSVAYQECLQIINFLQRHPKGGVFQEPVDPIALNIPSYRSIVRQPMDVSTLKQKLERGDYSILPPSHMKGEPPVVRMLNGPFRKDVELIFDNAMLFNPPDDWIYKTAAVVKKSVVKKIEQASTAAGSKSSAGRKRQKSVYVDYDSDVDMYVYESEHDDEYDPLQKKRKRKGSLKPTVKEDASARVVERGIRLQKVLSESLGLRGPFSTLFINSNAAEFTLPTTWKCRNSIAIAQQANSQKSTKPPGDRLDTLFALHRQLEDSEYTGVRRSTRASEQQAADPTSTLSGGSVEYVYENASWETDTVGSRTDVERERERIHEEYFAKRFHGNKEVQKNSIERFGVDYVDDLYPPFLGRVVPESSAASVDAIWEIREPLVIPALRWILRGLIHSEHLAELEPGEPLTTNVIVPNHIYFVNQSQAPFDVLNPRESGRRKRANTEENKSSEDEVELSAYEKARAERVARNAERLQALGLT